MLMVAMHDCPMHGRPMHRCCATIMHTHLFKHGIFMIFYTLLLSDLPTVRYFLLKQTQLKCLVLRLVANSRNVIDTVQVLKSYNGIAT